MTAGADGFAKKKKRRLFKAGIYLAFVFVWGALAGRVLVNDQAPGRADAIFVLSGDRLGERLQKGAEVAKSTGGLLLVSLRTGRIYDPREAATNYIKEQGLAEQRVRFLPAGDSTAEEAGTAAVIIGRCEWKNVGVVTSPYHTRRAGWLFRRAIGDKADVRIIASEDPFNAGTWWSNDRDSELVILEWVKGVSSARYIFKRPLARDTGVSC